MFFHSFCLPGPGKSSLSCFIRNNLIRDETLCPAVTCLPQDLSSPGSKLSSDRKESRRLCRSLSCCRPPQLSDLFFLPLKQTMAMCYIVAFSLLPVKQTNKQRQNYTNFYIFYNVHLLSLKQTITILFLFLLLKIYNK